MTSIKKNKFLGLHWHRVCLHNYKCVYIFSCSLLLHKSCILGSSVMGGHRKTQENMKRNRKKNVIQWREQEKWAKTEKPKFIIHKKKNHDCSL